MEKKILCRAVIEVLGKPREHVESVMQGYVEKIIKDETYNVLRKDFAEAKKQESEMWATFTELEFEMKELTDLTNFCFNYMPSVIEILEPESLVVTSEDFTAYINDLQAKLHNVDMVAKQVKFENDSLKKNMSRLLSNYLVILLGKKEMTSEEMSKYTGVDKAKVEDFLDSLLDKGTVKMKDGVYSLVKEKFDK
ncbi:hypothetical protein HOC13_03550 [Candidatus Woesearchaeota archaeon]|jgi:hypothetical protein|nr:hypothetical protein [Candidatus Woesearchaeota archaeon]